MTTPHDDQELSAYDRSIAAHERAHHPVSVPVGDQPSGVSAHEIAVTGQSGEQSAQGAFDADLALARLSMIRPHIAVIPPHFLARDVKRYSTIMVTPPGTSERVARRIMLTEVWAKWKWTITACLFLLATAMTATLGIDWQVAAGLGAGAPVLLLVIMRRARKRLGRQQARGLSPSPRPVVAFIAGEPSSVPPATTTHLRLLENAWGSAPGGDGLTEDIDDLSVSPTLALQLISLAVAIDKAAALNQPERAAQLHAQLWAATPHLDQDR